MTEHCAHCGVLLTPQTTISESDEDEPVCLSERCQGVDPWKQTDARVKAALDRMERRASPPIDQRGGES